MANLTNITGQKIDAPTLAHILKYYGRFGNQQQQISAYERRKERQRRGLDLRRPADVITANELGILHNQPVPYGTPRTPLGGQQDTAGPANLGGPFGVGSGKVPPMTGAATGPGLGGSPTPGRPIVDPNAPVPMAGEPIQAVPPQPGASMQPVTPLASMLAIPPPKSRSKRRLRY